MTQPAAVLQIVILRDGLLVGTEVFTPGKYTLGSASTAELRLDDSAVEPLHGVLYFHNGRAAIQDGNSRSGISVNGHRIRACEIRPQDEVHVGPFLLKVRVLTKQAEPQRAATPPEVAALLGAPAPHAPRVPQVPPVAPPPVHAQQFHAQQVNAQQMPQARPASAPPPSIAPAVMPVAPPRAVSHALADTAPERVPLPSSAPAPSVPPMRLVQPPRPTPAGTLPSVRRMAELSQPTPAAQHAQVSDTAAFDIDESTAVRAPAPTAPSNVASASSSKDGRLNLELWWGADRQHARSFGTLPEKTAVQGAHSDDAAFPLWGFTLPANPQGFELLQRHAGTWRLFVPPESRVELRRPGTTAFQPIPADRLGEENGRRFIDLSHGTAARLSEGSMSLLAYPAPPAERMRGSLLAGIPWLVITLFLLLGGGFTSLVVLAPEPHEVPDFAPRHIPPVAVKLMAPEPKKKEEAAKKLAELKEKAPAKATKEAVPKESAPKVAKRTEKRSTAPASTQENKALKALSRLTAAGPATTDVLAAVDKMGGGPGSKKSNSFKLSDMVGKDPIANAGIGAVGLGGGGGGGRGTRGIEVLQGKGGGGIGALGARGYGSGGSVGGTVTRASARQVGAQGSIDRDAVARVINANLQAVRGCYERALLKEPGLAGKAVLEWTINTKGAVTTAKTKSSTLRNAAVESCILRSIKTWKFPAAKGGQVIVTYPFVFNSVGY